VRYETAALILMALLASAPGCGTGEAATGRTTSSAGDAAGDGGKDEKKVEAVPVEVAELDRGEIEAVLRFSANLEAEESVQVFSQAKRLVTELLVEEGDRVRANQVLLRLQDDEQRSALQKVKSDLDRARREYERQKRLYAQELISEQAFHDATFERDQLEISHADAERELGYTEVRAPIAGTVTSRLVGLGDQVQIGQHLFDIVDFDSLVARVFVPEKHLQDLRKDLIARVSAQAAGGRVHDVSVRRVAPVVDPRSGTVKVTVNVGGKAGLLPGMYVDVELVTAAHPNAVLVPKRALVHDGETTFVFRLGDDRKVERVPVEALLTDKTNVEPRAGFVAGDRVVVAGHAGLKDGALVRLPGDPEPADETTERDPEPATAAAAT